MSYLVLARKYRPVDFAAVIGQEHITELLTKAIANNRLTHAFLFCGPRGIGKTSCARILAKSLNCQKGPTDKPCGECSACREITAGNSFDVLEIDGASNRGIDEMRTLRENVKFAPSFGKFKIYIVDEVHMLTTEAFNALLKTLEEPPEHVKFIFATTDPNKVPATIISRCQRYDFKRISLKQTVAALEPICQKEKFDIDQDALYAIAKASQGSFRDALSILDQVSALSDRSINSEDVFGMLGIVELDRLFDIATAIARKDCASVFSVFDGVIEAGKDIKQLSKDLIEHFRNLMIIKVGGKSLGRLVDYPVAIKDQYLQQSREFSLKNIIRTIDLLIEAQDVARVTETLRTPLEIAFAKLTYQGEVPADQAQVAVDQPERTPRSQPATKPAAPEPAAVRILKDKKGQVNAPDDPLPPDLDPDEEAVEDSIPSEEPVPEGLLDLDKIKKSWDALTYAVSRHKMFLATYLQEGSPVAFERGKLVIGFPKDKDFQKESLETDEYIRLVEDIFSEKLRCRVGLEYSMDESLTGEMPLEAEEEIQSAIDTFGGKVVSKWHQE